MNTPSEVEAGTNSDGLLLFPALAVIQAAARIRHQMQSTGNQIMARRYSRSASKDVERAMRKRKRGSLKSGRSGRKVTSRKQAIAIGLSEARREGKKVPPKKGGRKRRRKSK
jgi:Family of unknown function (DUF6496)